MFKNESFQAGKGHRKEGGLRQSIFLWGTEDTSLNCHSFLSIYSSISCASFFSLRSILYCYHCAQSLKALPPPWPRPSPGCFHHYLTTLSHFISNIHCQPIEDQKIKRRLQLLVFLANILTCTGIRNYFKSYKETHIVLR